MSIITNQDILDAIRGLYQNTPNKVSDAAAQNELALIKAELIAGLSVSNWPTLQQVKAADTDTALATILGKLEDIESELAAIKTTDGIKKIADTVGITAGDDAIAALGALSASAVTDPSASGTVIALLKGLLKQLQGSGAGAAPVEVKGSIDTVDSEPVTGVKTVTTTAAEIFAGASRKENRRYLIIKNESTQYRIRIGGATINPDTGWPIEPGGCIEFNFDPSIPVQIFAISDSANPVEVAVMEV